VINGLNSMSLEEIKNCKYLSSVGLLSELDQLDIITYSNIPSNIRHDFSKIQNGYDGVTIYVKFSNFMEFVYHILPQINYKFILITGDGDETMPIDMMDNETFNNIVNNNNIIHWYSVNCLSEMHEKLTIIPIGVNFHSLSYGEFCGWHDSAISPLNQEKIMIDIKNESKPFEGRERLCYSNFHFVTYNEFGNSRKEAIEKIPKDLVYYEPNFIKRDETWKNQSKFSFVLSPMGHGMDCHRTWEALILGCIVIVKKSVLDVLYEDLPVLIVDNWSDITKELLDTTIENFKTKNFNYDKITLEYWVRKIKETKKIL
jgi:hypothetical protein